MASVLEFVDALARVLVEALLNSLWQGLLILVLVWLLMRLSPRASATTRHAVWFVSLLAILLLPIFTGARAWRKDKDHAVATPVTSIVRTPVTTTSLPLIALQTSLPTFAKPKPASVSSPVAPAVVTPMRRDAVTTATSACCANAASPPVTGVFLNDTAIAAARPRNDSQSVTFRWLTGRLPLGLALLWLIGSGLMLTRFAGSYLALFCLRRSMTDVPAEISARMERLAVVYGMRRQLRVTASTQAQMPMTIGWRKPLIILPRDLAQTLTPAECDSVMAHELAHIKRHDYATNFAQRLAQCVFCFHPAVWFISKQLVIERELACDDWAVKLTGEPRRYAGCLTKLVELLSESKPLLAATGILFGKHIITRRVEMILNRDRNATTSISKPALAYAIVLATLCVAICSSLSPVIAVPLAQKPQEKAAKPVTPKAPKTPIATMPAPAALAPVVSDDLLELDAPLGRIVINGDLLELPSPAALADLSERALDLTRGLNWAELSADALAPIAPLAPLAQLDELRYAEGRNGLLGQQSGEKKAPAIPEEEMLKLLSDIVKRDTDANVRAEALSGIYRLRSDAAINTLIQLYDQVTDVKTKGDILARLIRRTGDNTKALAKLVQVVKTEKDETLVSRALGLLGYLKGDEGADQLVQIYDGLQDSKMKQRVIRSLGINKSKKAIEKLMTIAKSDGDPILRQAALRSLSSLDGDSFNFGTGTVRGIVAPRVQIERDGAFNFNQDQMQEMQRDAQEKMREAQERFRESQERMREDIENRVWREKRRNEPDSPEPVQPPAAGKKPTAAVPTPKAAPKAAIAGGISI